MKRALGLIFIIAFCVVGFFSVWGNIPFVPIFGSSMEPGLKSGSLLIIKSIAAEDVKGGDIIVYNVPSHIRENYNYPPTIAHRVVKVEKDQHGLWFQIKGDNAGVDPFLIRAQDIRGTSAYQIPYLGLPLLLFQSGLGTIFVVIAIVLLAILFYTNEISRGIGRLFRTVLSPTIEENLRADIVLSHRFEATERALDSFASAMQLYAQHMSSHTSAIRGLSEASQALKGSAVEQNRILGHMTKTIERERSEREISRVERVFKEIERKTLQALQAKYELEKKLPGQEVEPEQEPLLRAKMQPPPGCAAKPKALLARITSKC
jgi:signal peptidase I